MGCISSTRKDQTALNGGSGDDGERTSRYKYETISKVESDNNPGEESEDPIESDQLQRNSSYDDSRSEIIDTAKDHGQGINITGSLVVTGSPVNDFQKDSNKKRRSGRHENACLDAPLPPTTHIEVLMRSNAQL